MPIVVDVGCALIPRCIVKVGTHRALALEDNSCRGSSLSFFHHAVVLRSWSYLGTSHDQREPAVYWSVGKLAHHTTYRREPHSADGETPECGEFRAGALCWGKIRQSCSCLAWSGDTAWLRDCHEIRSRSRQATGT